MRAIALVSRTKKFFSKKRRVAKTELDQIHADGHSRRSVLRDAHEFQMHAVANEERTAFFRAKELGAKKILHDVIHGRKSNPKYEDRVLQDPVRLRVDIERAQENLKVYDAKAKQARQRAVVRRLYSLKLLRKRAKKTG